MTAGCTKKPHALQLLLPLLAVFLLAPAGARAQATGDPFPADTQHPALFLVGDSIMRTGVAPGDTGPWGWGAEIIPMFDAAISCLVLGGIDCPLGLRLVLVVPASAGQANYRGPRARAR